MRNPVRGWRSARRHPARASVAAAAPVPFGGPAPAVPQQPLRLGLGLVALVFYLWIIHSYKLPAGEIALLTLGAGVLARGGDIRLPGPLVVFAVFILWAAVGLGVTADTATTLNALTDLLKLWVISFLIVNVVRTPAELRFLTIAWLAVFALYPVRGALYNQFICHCTEFGRVAWNFVFENPNDLAALCLIPMGAAAGVASVERVKLFRYAGLLGVGVLALIVMLTQSRGAMLALGVAAVMLPLISRRRSRDIVLLALLLSSAALVAPKGVWERLKGLSNASVETGMADVDPEGSAASRWQVWGIAAAEVRKQPVTGIGLGMMPAANRLTALRLGLDWGVRGLRDTHSTYLRHAAETGLIGLAIYLVMWGVAMAGLSRAKKATRHVRPREHQFLTFLQLSVVAFLVASVFGTYGSLSFTYLMLAYIWLASDILSRHPWYVPQKLGAPAAVPAAGDVPARSLRQRPLRQGS